MSDGRMYSYECQSALKTERKGKGGGKIIKIKIKFPLRHNLAKTLFGVRLYLVRRHCVHRRRVYSARYSATL